MAHHHGLKENTLYKAYKNKLSGFTEWSELEHADEYLLRPENLLENIHLDETKLGDNFYTMLSKRSKERKGTLIGMIRGTRSDIVSGRLRQIPEIERLKVKEVAMDMADGMKLIAKKNFQNAIITIDRFHVAKRCGEALEDIRLKHKQEAVKDVDQQRTAWNHKCAEARKKRKAYRMKHPRKGKKSRRGRKIVYLRANFFPKRYDNGETLIELLTRCKYSLNRRWDKISKDEQERLKILFRVYPDLREAYVKTGRLRYIYSSKYNREEAVVKLNKWLDSIGEKSSKELRALKRTIKQQKEYILNYFVHRSSNALAENFNSRMKGFRALLRGISDFKFFVFRLQKIYG